MLDDQVAFDIAAKHLLTQSQQSRCQKPFTAACAYRGDGELKCAVGAFIPDKHYDPSMEGKTVRMILNMWPALKEHLPEPDLGDELQTIHDTYQPQEWRARLANLARRWGLNPAILEEFA